MGEGNSQLLIEKTIAIQRASPLLLVYTIANYFPEIAMSLENHSLISEFPNMREQIHQLKTSDNHFARLFDDYDRVVHLVQRIESGAEPAADEHLEVLKKQRLILKDELFSLLKAA